MPLAAPLVPAWAKGAHVSNLKMIPLAWRRPISLPDHGRLEAWYLWNPGMPMSEWVLNPQQVISGSDLDEDDCARLKILIFEAAILTPTRSHTLSCASLFTSLALKSNGCLWIVPDVDESVSVWTDAAFQLHHGKLG